MLPKILACLIVMAATTLCQHHEHHTISLQSVVKHEVPKKVEHYQVEYKAAPVAHHTVQYKAAPIAQQLHAVHGHAGYGHVLSSNSGHHAAHTHGHPAPKLFIPVHEIVQEAAPVPVAPALHTVHAPVQVVHAPVQHIVQVPVHHIPVHHVPVHIPIQHHVQTSHHQEARHEQSHHQESHHEQSHHEESHHEESHHDDHHEHDIDYYAHPKYEYEYKVEDPHTGDKKFQHESRDGDVVKGVYSLHEPDGSIRTVNYSSDKKSGFNANIVHKGHSKHEYHHHH